jgi:hypothetical protein
MEVTVFWKNTALCECMPDIFLKHSIRENDQCKCEPCSDLI